MKQSRYVTEAHSFLTGFIVPNLLTLSIVTVNYSIFIPQLIEELASFIATNLPRPKSTVTTSPKKSLATPSARPS